MFRLRVTITFIVQITAILLGSAGGATAAVIVRTLDDCGSAGLGLWRPIST